MIKLKSSMKKHSKKRPMKQNQSGIYNLKIYCIALHNHICIFKGDSDSSYNGDNSNSSSGTDTKTKEPPKKTKMGYKSSLYNYLYSYRFLRNCKMVWLHLYKK